MKKPRNIGVFWHFALQSALHFKKSGPRKGYRRRSPSAARCRQAVLTGAAGPDDHNRLVAAACSAAVRRQQGQAGEGGGVGTVLGRVQKIETVS